MSSNVEKDELKVPGRVFGFSVMSITTLFVIYFLNLQANSVSSTNVSDSFETPDRVAGFNADLWYLADEQDLGFVEIPAGSFIMGSNPSLDRMAYENERWSDLRRQGEVDLPRYYISRHETTNAQFAAYLSDAGINATQSTAADDPSLPVVNITWTEALAYTRWLEAKLRESSDTPESIRSLLNDGWKVSLPSEAEWEKAARGTDGRIFPWRDVPANSVANFNGQALRPVSTALCEQCVWGLNDMAGNAWELTRSPLQDYPYTPQNDAEDLMADALYVMRGGSFADPLNNIRAAVRGGADPGVRNAGIGFRVVITSL